MKSSLLRPLAVVIIAMALLLNLGCSKEENPVESGNSRPIVAITNLAVNASYVVGDTITFTATATDAEDGELAGGSLVWASSIDGVFGSGISCQIDTLSINTHLIILTATDSDGAVGADTATIIINQYGSPVVTISSPENNTNYSIGDTITFTATATDAEDGELADSSLVWASSIDGVFGSGISCQIDTLSINTHIIIITATDSDGAVGADSVTIIISAGAVGEGIEFAGLVELVENIAPPVYSVPQAAPTSENDSMWIIGDYPLLGKVFSASEPMSLYANMTNLDNILSQISEMSAYIEDVENANDTVVSFGGQQDFTMELVNLESETTLPAEYENVFWFTSINLDQAIKLESTEANNLYSMHCGYFLSDTAQKILVYHTMSDGTIDESSLFYAYVNLVDSSINIKGLFYKDYGDNTSARWAYQIYTAEIQANFGYRMSWYADEVEESSFLGCIIGGGNKDDEFALLYRQFIPADTAVCDSNYILDQIFDANFNLLPLPEWGLGTSVYEGDLFTYDDMPATLIQSPWAE